ncbi:MAG: serine/threonine protein kinase [Myxococcales bacterium]|nr:MAG: serine/threonine protein kinase [Myxococcales bacterium]
MTMRWPPLTPDGVRASTDQVPDSTPTPPISIGSVVAGKYQVDRVIGFGGMGIVCAATHVELGTPVAIKFVRPERASDDRAVARFLTEARAAAQLQSQFACRVIDYGRLPSGSPYLVMEFLVGQDLRSLVSARGPLGTEEAVALALQACEALAEAHSKHIVHRDVKPENLFIAEGPGGARQLKVLDFGISKQLSQLGPQRSLTDSTESIGSPSHMSPEQMIDPAGVDSRTDIWSLGVVLYEMLTGQMPFAGESGPQLCANVMTTQPLPLQAHHVEIPERLSQIVLRCLEKDRAQRFHDVGELSVALREFGGETGALAAARVQRIFGRTTSATPSTVASAGAGAGEEAKASPFASDPTLPIPGMPRRGLGVRVAVGLSLLAASGLAAYAVRRSVVPARSEESTPAPPVLLPPTSASVVVTEPAPPPAPLPVPTVRVKPKLRPAPAAPSHQAVAPPVPEASAASSAVYPELKPLPLDLPADVPPPPAAVEAEQPND